MATIPVSINDATALGSAQSTDIIPVARVGNLTPTTITVADITGPIQVQLDNKAPLNGATLDPASGTILFPRVTIATAPTATVSATAGNLNGATQYSVSFVTIYGETESYLNSATVTPVDQQVDLTAIPVSSNPDVIARKIYRTPVGAEDPVIKKLVGTISDNTTTTFTDNVADVDLGTDVLQVNTTGGTITTPQGRVSTVGGLTTSYGFGTIQEDTGYANSAFGANALPAVTTGRRNVAVGVDSLFSATDGSRNIAVGVHALNDLTTGDDNVAVGYLALSKVTTVGEQVAVGNLVLSNCTSGTGNTGAGHNALNVCSTGFNNTATGSRALTALTTGSNNTAVGLDSAKAVTTATFNTAIGAQALRHNTTGGGNTAVGNLSLYTMGAGYGNVALGNFAGYWETGQQKLFIDNQQRTNEADGRIKALVYGVFDPDPNLQHYRINAVMELPYCPVYADNAAAITGGLTAGQVYRTSTGTLMVAY